MIAVAKLCLAIPNLGVPFKKLNQTFDLYRNMYLHLCLENFFNVILIEFNAVWTVKFVTLETRQETHRRVSRSKSWKPTGRFPGQKLETHQLSEPTSEFPAF